MTSRGRCGAGLELIYTASAEHTAREQSFFSHSCSFCFGKAFDLGGMAACGSGWMLGLRLVTGSVRVKAVCKHSSPTTHRASSLQQASEFSNVRG